MTICATVNIETNIVDNIIVAEVNDIPPEGTFLIEVTENNPCSIGMEWDEESSSFVDRNN